MASQVPVPANASLQPPLNPSNDAERAVSVPRVPAANGSEGGADSRCPRVTRRRTRSQLASESRPRERRQGAELLDPVIRRIPDVHTARVVDRDADRNGAPSIPRGDRVP